ncbi:ABC bile acid transporter [Xylona heveae TC161]|uniref:ABC bile acid transporter n=1 Tax=Xylona heveae (strain CBS 132557 / TC161) TaxID=1328760 RepID=A0A165JGU4_XYLHT|nr:ABC bile acid transporter [Xylona heveae TC161]KZF26219.1 ABC bile acid transporter [Xylona heveae TC161]
MGHLAVVELVVGAVGTGAVAAMTLPGVVNLRKSAWSLRKDYEQVDALYEDQDGVATEKSQAAFSDKIPKLFVYLSSVLGSSVTLASALWATLNPEKSLLIWNWLQFGAWMLLILQAASFALEKDSVKRFRVSCYGAVSSFVLFLAIAVVNLLHFSKTGSTAKESAVHIGLQIGSAFATLVLLFAYLFIPRRADVYYNGRIVDRQYSATAIERLTYGWAQHVLDYAGKNKDMKIEEIPNVDYLTRSENLQQFFFAVQKGGRLGYRLLYAHANAFLWQTAYTIIQCFLQFGPQVAMYRILKYLEARAEGPVSAVEGWAYVLGLFLTMALSGWFDQRMFWVSWSRLAIPLRMQLSALVFLKAMKRKDAKGVEKASIKGDKSVDGASDAGDSKKESPEEDDLLQKTQQSTINLIGIDAKRVGEFCAWNNYIFGSVLRLAIALTFLQRLIGWPSLLAGLAFNILTLPFNIWASKRYGVAQDVLMKSRDRKMGVITEALRGIRQIKFSALERQWQDKIGEVREQELKSQWACFMADSVVMACWIVTPIMLSAVSLSTYALLHGGLAPSKAFTTLAVFANLEVTLSVIPPLIAESFDAWISLCRIEKFLNSPEKEDRTVDAEEIAFEGASVAWPADEDVSGDERFTLPNLNLRFPSKELSVICGATGSGKSLLLASVLGEVDILAGVVKIPKAHPAEKRFDHKANSDNWIIDSCVAYVAQTPWIENASVKNNILFGLPYDSKRYKKVLHACALVKDLEMLEDGENTEIGANGINLSGGQRWRLSFARALYSRAGILVLDDIFSAVDAHVGRHIFELGLTGELGNGRTRLLVTHHVGLCLPKAVYLVALNQEGTVQHAGLVEELRRSGSLSSIMERKDNVSEEEDKDSVIEDADVKDKIAPQPDVPVQFDDTNPEDAADANIAAKAAAKKFVQDEAKESGRVKWKVYGGYLKYTGGVLFWVMALLLFMIYQATLLAKSWWIKIWSSTYETEAISFQHVAMRIQTVPISLKKAASPSTDNDLVYYMGVYVGISIFVCILGTVRYIWLYWGSIRGSRILSDRMTHMVLRAPLRWLDTVPVGRILNRFTADFTVIDSNMSMELGNFLYNALMVVGSLVAGLFVSPYMIIFAVILQFTCWRVASMFLGGAREIKRLESNAKSPIFEHFGAALGGLSTIRAFDKTHDYISTMFERIDNHGAAFWYIFMLNRWLSLRLSFIGAIFCAIVSGIIVGSKSIDAALAGFALQFGLEYSECISWALRMYANVELGMNAAERILEYTEIKTENQGGESAPAAWPSEGRLVVKNLVAGYAEDLPPVLKGLSFEVEANKRIGVVGRTGAGKSSLTLALFRFLEARKGSITIDGIDIYTLKLHELRSRLAIIPQDPVLFSGTVRSNLDPFDQYEDYQLRDALERAHLIKAERSGQVTPGLSQEPANANIFEDLSSAISEGGHSLSQGQRQLLCLARAIVSRPKIMVLDEATSAVDMDTDALIQQSIREEFNDSTLIVIAHRLSTIADFDKILVMSDGRVEEYDEPHKLMEQKGDFYRMVNESGEKEKLEAIIANKAKASS